MLKNMIISLLSLFVMVVEVNAMEKENDCIFNNISNKTIKNWNQDDFCDALKNNSMLKHLLESNRVVKFSNAKCSTEVLNNLKIAFDKLGVKAIISMNVDVVGFIKPLTKGQINKNRLRINRDTGINSLTIPEGLVGLQNLDFCSNNSLEFIMFPEIMTGLKTLKLNGNRFLKSIVFPKGMVSLKTFELSSNKLSALVTMPEGMTNLQTLKLNGNRFLKSIVFPKDMESLKSLELINNRLLASIVIPTGMTSLHTLKVNNERSALQSIAIPSDMTNLRTLDLSSNPNLQFLELPDGIENLQTIDLRNTSISLNDIVALRHRYPGVVLSNFDQQANQQIVAQELLVQKRASIRKAYEELATNEATAQLISANLPTIETTKEKFFYAAADVKSTLGQALSMNDLKFTDGQQFRLVSAVRSLRLLQGDSSIEKHGISSLESYATYVYPSLPNIRQLFVLAYNLLSGSNVEQQQKEFVASYLVNNDKWNAVKTIFKIDDALGVVLQKPNNVVDTLCALMANSNEAEQKMAELQGKNSIIFRNLMKGIKKDFLTTKLDKLNPLVEALFMIMRGHNDKLENSNEPNKPACAEGAYLNIMKILREIEKTKNAMEVIGNIQITLCNGMIASIV